MKMEEVRLGVKNRYMYQYVAAFLLGINGWRQRCNLTSFSSEYYREKPKAIFRGVVNPVE
ncbi:hypothetical protein PCAR4_210104 [Paraburkholderia caribensis]|nr:hypothetical protein PCAR4_210104 [Paraburkholderia caribensis]